MIKLKWVHLHQAAFIAGTNMGDKLDITKRTGLEMSYDPSTMLLTAKYKGEEALITFPSIFTMVELKEHAKVKVVK